MVPLPLILISILSRKPKVMKIIFRIGAAVLISSTLYPATAQDAQARPEKQRKICRAQGAETGSIMGQRRVCRSKADWAKIVELDQRATDRALDARRINNDPRPGR